jgi:polysaccharide deacetylase family protein (PEP-CTERM system associated)
MERILSVLEKHNVRASFFCLGWIAEKHPDIIRTIDKLGYEIGSHSYHHQLVYEQDKNVFRTDVEKSVKTIEDIIGKKVRIYRAPGFSITETTTWAFEILCDMGIEVDSSVFPAKRAHGGFPSYGKGEPSVFLINGKAIKEFPINVYPFLSRNIVFSGGGYFRLLPYSFIKRFSKNSAYIMTYFHPRDFDANQPMIQELPLSRKFKSYVGLKSALSKLDKYLTDFSFIDITTAEKETDWDNVKTFDLTSIHAK